jgi:hypothetical protein
VAQVVECLPVEIKALIWYHQKKKKKKEEEERK